MFVQSYSFPSKAPRIPQHLRPRGWTSARTFLNICEDAAEHLW